MAWEVRTRGCKGCRGCGRCRRPTDLQGMVAASAAACIAGDGGTAKGPARCKGWVQAASASRFRGVKGLCSASRIGSLGRRIARISGAAHSRDLRSGARWGYLEQRSVEDGIDQIEVRDGRQMARR
jgi:hypothetical protein